MSIEKFWNKEIASHPLNWLIVVVVAVWASFLIHSWLIHKNMDQPVTRRHHARKGKKANSQANASAASLNANDPGPLPT